MKKLLKQTSICILSLVVLFSLFSCSLDKTTSSDNEVTVGVTQEISVLDPHYAVAAGDQEIQFNIFEGLLKFDHEGNLNPCLATSYDISSDGLEYIFTIREGVSFHDGSRLTLEDVIFSLSRVSGNLPSGEPALVSELDSISSIDAISDNQIKITLEEPNSEILSYFTTAIVTEASINTDSYTPIGTGPFKFDHYNIGEELVLIKNEDYWDSSLPYLDKVTFKICADYDSGFIELQNGGIDIFPYLTPDKVDELDPAKFNIHAMGSNMVQVLGLNNEFAPFSDLRVRQAINYAINREDIISLIMDGQGEELTTAMSPVMGDSYNTEIDGTYYHDIERAQSLMNEAGYEDGFDLTITVPSNYLQHVNTAVVIVDQLADIGINATIEQVDWATWLSEVYTDRNYEATVIAVTSDYAPYDVLSRYASTASGNFINYSNEEVDSLLLEILNTPDESRRIELYHELLVVMTNDAPSAFIEDPYSVCAVSSRVTGYNLYPMYVQDMSTVRVSE